MKADTAAIGPSWLLPQMDLHYELREGYWMLQLPFVNWQGNQLCQDISPYFAKQHAFRDQFGQCWSWPKSGS